MKLCAPKPARTQSPKPLAVNLTDMCKTIFIATKEPLTEIPFNEADPNFTVTKITDEFLIIKNKFSNKNIYLVNTSRGCGCDFGIAEIPDLAGFLEKEKERLYPIDKMAEKIRTLLGRQEEWKKKHIAKVVGQLDNEKFFVSQTHILISLIKDNMTSNSDVELYCCWAGDYDTPTEKTKYIDIDDKEFFDTFDLELNEKIVIHGPKASGL